MRRYEKRSEENRRVLCELGKGGKELFLTHFKVLSWYSNGSKRGKLRKS